jgi:uncharacterized protein
MNGMDRFTGKLLSGAAHLRQSLADIIGTPLGTRVCRRDYGSIVPELLDQPMNDLTRIQLYAATALAVSRQERRLRLTRVGFAPTGAAGTFELILAGVSREANGRRTPISFSLPVRAQSALFN